MAALAQREPTIQLIEVRTLPSGWNGKAHACWLGAQGAESEWLCFVDADTISKPSFLRTAVEFALT